MSDVPQPGGPGWPFGPGGFDPAQMMRILQSEGPVNWEVAGQIAAWVAVADPESGAVVAEPVVEPAAEAQLDELVRAAQTHVAEATGIVAVHGVASRVVDRRGWAAGTLTGLRPVLEALATALQQTPDVPPDVPGGGPDAGAAGPAGLFGAAGADPFGGLLGMLAPVLLGVQAGSMIGYLAQQALGQYDLPLPLSGEPALAFVLRNVDDFADAWSLPRDDLRFALALREVVHAAERTVPWARNRLVRLATDFVSAYELDPDALEQQLGDVDMTDPSSITEMVGDPEALLGAMRSPRQAAVLEELQRLGAVLEGYADDVVDRIGAPLVSSFDRIHEALLRQRVDRGQAASFVDQLLGLELRREHYEQGREFCRGVVERSGPEGLNRLWERESMLPTRAELEAPGLWLARIELDLDGS